MGNGNGYESCVSVNNPTQKGHVLIVDYTLLGDLYPDAEVRGASDSNLLRMC